MNENILSQLGGPPQGPTSFKVGPTPIVNKTFFYEQPNTGKVISVGEKEAWSLHKKGWKQVGCSDGLKFQQAAAEGQKIYNDQIKAFKLKNPGVVTPEEYKQEALVLALERIKQGELEEIEAARGNIVVPADFDYMGHADAINMIKPR